MRIFMIIIFSLTVLSCKSLTSDQDSALLNYEEMELCEAMRSDEDCRLKQVDATCGLQKTCTKKERVGEKDISGSKAVVWLCSCE